MEVLIAINFNEHHYLVVGDAFDAYVKPELVTRVTHAPNRGLRLTVKIFGKTLSHVVQDNLLGSPASTFAIWKMAIHKVDHHALARHSARSAHGTD